VADAPALRTWDAHAAPADEHADRIATLEAEVERLRILHAQTRGLLEQACASRDAIAEERDEARVERDRLRVEIHNYERNHGARCAAEQERYATIAESACRMLDEARRKLNEVAGYDSDDDGLISAVMASISTFLSLPSHEAPGLRAQVTARDASIDALTERIRLLLAADPWRGQLADLLADRDRIAKLAAERRRTIEAMCACNERALEASGRVMTVLDAGVVR
jgi:chromosome segregation ATPase